MTFLLSNLILPLVSFGKCIAIMVLLFMLQLNFICSLIFYSKSHHPQWLTPFKLYPYRHLVKLVLLNLFFLCQGFFFQFVGNRAGSLAIRKIAQFCYSLRKKEHKLDKIKEIYTQSAFYSDFS